MHKNRAELRWIVDRNTFLPNKKNKTKVFNPPVLGTGNAGPATGGFAGVGVFSLVAFATPNTFKFILAT